MIEDQIRAIVKDEVEKMLRPLAEDISTYAEGNQKDLSALKELIQRNVIELQKVTVMIQSEMEVRSPKSLPKQLVDQPKEKPTMKEPVKTVAYTEETGSEEESEPEEEAVTHPREWVKEQKGDMEKGETQVWRFGEHTLTLWMDGKKQIAQVDDGEAEELWKQKDLEKIQKRIVKMGP
jgi:hypothetical protein